MVYLDPLYVYILLRKQHVKCGPAADYLGCRISIKMASQPCGDIIANIHEADTVRVFTARAGVIHEAGYLHSLRTSQFHCPFGHCTPVLFFIIWKILIVFSREI